MTSGRRLRLQGSDVALVRRDLGAVVVVYLDRDGQPTQHNQTCWPHDLIGNGWHLADVKRAIAALPDRNGPVLPQPVARPRGLLHAHHAADALTTRED